MMGDTEKVFNADELREYDGKDGRPVYVAYTGRVYDLTDSISWEDGKHYDVHVAGRDLTEEMESAPHGEDILDVFSVVGRDEE